MCSVMDTIKGIPASAAFMMGSAPKEPGTKMTDAFAFVSATASDTVLKTGTPSTSVPPLPGVTPATTFVPKARICAV
jgi:hypothetical protein